eukprot:TRINITY_DN10012_c0_g1_i7.p1 TRINITY_DN10012_c0_g1~~TRINITY_DN10012_c0_g1_i7.p1  ORF type:complete len:1216 (-),score=233.07 TRINITY_DN10012_c0_g1_i7:37-3684(-)
MCFNRAATPITLSAPISTPSGSGAWPCGSTGSSLRSPLSCVFCGVCVRVCAVALGTNCVQFGDCTKYSAYETEGCFGRYEYSRDSTDSFVAGGDVTYNFDDTLTAPYFVPYTFPVGTTWAFQRVISNVGFEEQFTIGASTDPEAQATSITDRIAKIESDWITSQTRTVQLALNYYYAPRSIYVNTVCTFDVSPSMVFTPSFTETVVYTDNLFGNIMVWTVLLAYVLIRSNILLRNLYAGTVSLLKQWAYQRSAGVRLRVNEKSRFQAGLLFCRFHRAAAFWQITRSKDILEMVLILLFIAVVVFDITVRIAVEELPDWAEIVQMDDEDNLDYDLEIEDVSTAQNISALLFAIAMICQFVFVVATFENIFFRLGPLFINITYMFKMLRAGVKEVAKLFVSAGLPIIGLALGCWILHGTHEFIFSRWGVSSITVLQEMARSYINPDFVRVVVTEPKPGLPQVITVVVGILLVVFLKGVIAASFSAVMVVVVMKHKDEHKNDEYVLNNLRWEQIVIKDTKKGNPSFCRRVLEFCKAMGRTLIGVHSHGQMTVALRMIADSHDFLVDMLRDTQRKAISEANGAASWRADRPVLISRTDFESLFTSTNADRSEDERCAYALLWTSLRNFTKQYKLLSAVGGPHSMHSQSPPKFSDAINRQCQALQSKLCDGTELFRHCQAFLLSELVHLNKIGKSFYQTGTQDHDHFNMEAALESNLWNPIWASRTLSVSAHIVNEISLAEITAFGKPAYERRRHRRRRERVGGGNLAHTEEETQNEQYRFLMLKIHQLRAESPRELSRLERVWCRVELLQWVDANHIQCHDTLRVFQFCDTNEDRLLDHRSFQMFALTVGRQHLLPPEVLDQDESFVADYRKTMQLLFPEDRPCLCQICTEQTVFAYWLPGVADKVQLQVSGNQREVMERCFQLLLGNERAGSVDLADVSSLTLRHMILGRLMLLPGLQQVRTSLRMPGADQAAADKNNPRQPLAVFRHDLRDSSHAHFAKHVVELLMKESAFRTHMAGGGFGLKTSFQVAQEHVAAKHPTTRHIQLMRLRPAFCSRQSGEDFIPSRHEKGVFRKMDSVICSKQYAHAVPLRTSRSTTLLEAQWGADHQFLFGLQDSQADGDFRRRASSQHDWRRTEIHSVSIKIFANVDQPLCIGQAIAVIDGQKLDGHAPQSLVVRPATDHLGIDDTVAVSYTHLRAHETPEHLVCRLLLEKKKKKK